MPKLTHQSPFGCTHLATQSLAIPNIARCPTVCIFLATQSSAAPKLTPLHIPPTIWVILTIVMDKQADRKLPSDTKCVAHTGGREGFVLPNINKAIVEVTRVASIATMRTGAQITVGKVQYNVSILSSTQIYHHSTWRFQLSDFTTQWEKVAIDVGRTVPADHKQTWVLMLQP